MGDGTGASSGGLLRRLGADRGRHADGRLDGSAAGQSDAGHGREHARAGLLASADMEERAAAGRVVRGDPAVVGATAGDDLAVGGGRAADVEGPDAFVTTCAQRGLASGFTLLERVDQASQSGGGEKEKVGEGVHLDGWFVNE